MAKCNEYNLKVYVIRRHANIVLIGIAAVNICRFSVLIFQHECTQLRNYASTENP